MRLGCVVMASGESQRFGGNKLLAPFQGAPLILRALSALPDELDTVVVTRQREIAQLAGDMGLSANLHALPDVSDTVRLGTEAMRDTDGCLFLVGDQPLLTRRTIEALISAFRLDPSRIVRAAHRGKPGNPVLFPSALYPELMALPAGKGGNFVAVAHPERVTLCPVEDGCELMDCDTPQQLGELERFARHSAKAN